MGRVSQTGSPGRYSRSFNGLVGALLVTVVGVVAFASVRGLASDSEPLAPTPVDYLELVSQAQAGGVELVYPASLPAGWTATDVDYEPGAVPSFGLSALTPDGEYAGVKAEATDLRQMLRTYVDESYREIEALEVPGAVAPRWEGFADDGGDTAYAATVGERQVLVFGSADPDQLTALVTSLTEEPVRPSA